MFRLSKKQYDARGFFLQHVLSYESSEGCVSPAAVYVCSFVLQRRIRPSYHWTSSASSYVLKYSFGGTLFCVVLFFCLVGDCEALEERVYQKIQKYVIFWFLHNLFFFKKKHSLKYQKYTTPLIKKGKHKAHNSNLWWIWKKSKSKKTKLHQKPHDKTNQNIM